MVQASADPDNQFSAMSPLGPSTPQPDFPAPRSIDANEKRVLKTLQLALASVADIAQGHGLWNAPRTAWGLSVQSETAANGSELLLLSGELDFASAPLIEECLAVAQDGHRSVLVDLEDLSFMDSNGIDVFLHAAKRADEMSAKLQILNSHKHRRVFVFCGAGFLLEEGGSYRQAPPSGPAEVTSRHQLAG